MARKTPKKKNGGGRHRPAIADSENFGAPPVPIGVLASEGAIAPAPVVTPPHSPELAPAPVDLAPLLLTVDQTCLLLGVSRAHFFRLKKAGSIPPAVNLGGLVRYRRQDIEDFVKQLEPSP